MQVLLYSETGENLMVRVQMKVKGLKVKNLNLNHLWTQIWGRYYSDGPVYKFTQHFTVGYILVTDAVPEE